MTLVPSVAQAPREAGSPVEKERNRFHDRIINALIVTGKVAGDAANIAGLTVGLTAKTAYKGVEGLFHGFAA